MVEESARTRAAANWHRAFHLVQVANGKQSAGTANDRGYHDTAAKRDTHITGETAWRNDRVGAVSSWAIQGDPAPDVQLPKTSARVSVLLRAAYGMPDECRTYAKVSCGGHTYSTECVTGVSSPTWQQLFTFDVGDPEHATLVFSCKHQRYLAVKNVSLGRVSVPLKEVAMNPEKFSEPRRLTLAADGIGAMWGQRPSTGRELEVQVFLSSRGQLAQALAGAGGGIRVLACSWNVGNALPPAPEQLRSQWLRGSGNAEHHLIAVSAQECRYQKQHTADAGTEDEDEDPSQHHGEEQFTRTKTLKRRISQNIKSAVAWEEHLAAALGHQYWLVGARHMYQTRMLLFARMDVVPFIKDVWTGFEATGIGRVGLNKGGVAVSLRVGSTHLAFIGSHLAAHQSECATRNKDVGEIIRELIPKGYDGNLVTFPDHVIWMGDLNYRVDWGQQAVTLSDSPTPADHASIVSLVQRQQYGELLACDQLAREMREGRVFTGFIEGPIAFPPTFKVLKGEAGLEYAKKRSPAWCDRVLVRSNLPHKAAHVVDYYCCPEIATSDHKPVGATVHLPTVLFPAPHPDSKFRFYVNNVRLDGEVTWRALSQQLVGKRNPLTSTPHLQLILSGLALGHKKHVVSLDGHRVAAGCRAVAPFIGQASGGSVTASASLNAGAAAVGPAHGVEAACSEVLTTKETSTEMPLASLDTLIDSKLTVRLVLREGTLLKQTLVALGVLPLNALAQDYSAGRFKQRPISVILETPQGVRLGAMELEAQIYSGKRTRHIAEEAIRQMTLSMKWSKSKAMSGSLREQPSA